MDDEFSVEKRSATMSGLAISIPITVALLALAGSIWVAKETVTGNMRVAKETVVGQFTAKAAELALQGEGPEEIINRANFLADLYADLLPEKSLNVLKKLKPEEAKRMVTQAPWMSNFQKEIVALLAKYPAQREQIIADYKSLYPDYHDFLDKLPPRLQSTVETKPER
jgi:hypothetical protein